MTVDSIGFQKKIVHKILDKNADYLLMIKGALGRLEQAFNKYFDMNMLQKHDGYSYGTQEQSRVRKKTILALMNSDLSLLGDV